MGNVWDMSDSLYTTKIDLRNFHRAAGGGGGRVDGGVMSCICSVI